MLNKIAFNGTLQQTKFKSYFNSQLHNNALQRDTLMIKFGNKSSKIEDYLKSLRDQAAAIEKWSLLYVPEKGRITQGHHPKLGMFRLFESLGSSEEAYYLEINGKKLPLSKEQYTTTRTNCLRDVADAQIGRIYGLGKLFDLTDLLNKLKNNTQAGSLKWHAIQPSSIDIEGIKPEIPTAKTAMLDDNTQVIIMYRQPETPSDGAFIGLSKPGYSGQLIAVSGDEEKRELFELSRHW